MEITPAELTILGLIIEQPRHGYDLEQVIEQRGIRRWADIGFSSIYYLLTKLGGRGLVAAEESEGGPRSRRIFHATAEGKQVAALGARELIADVQATPHPFLVGVANLSLLSDREYRDALRARLDQLDQRIASVKEAEQGQSPLPMPAREVFSYTLTLLEAERLWLAERVQASHD